MPLTPPPTSSFAATPQAHTPVMLGEVLKALNPKDGETYVDATFGRGGYSRAILDAAVCKVYAIDRDPDAIAAGSEMVDSYDNRLVLLTGPFSSLDTLLPKDIGEIHGVVFDFGVSSPQLEVAERGFSFRKDGPLDMRMSKSGMTAAEVVNSYSEEELAHVIYTYGGERFSRRIARAITKERTQKPLERTLELADIVRTAIPKHSGDIDPATRTFQALRIEVNDELREIEQGLEAAERVLCNGGRLICVSFHSLEDRIVKSFLKERSSAKQAPSRHQPFIEDKGPKPSFKLITRQAVKPGEAELKVNPRARSAKLRAAVRTQDPAHTLVHKKGGRAL